MVSLMTALWFSELRAEDRVSVKPHASPVLHAINYLLGRLDRSALETLRAFGGLQSYPSRTKDPDRSTTRPARSGSGRPPRSGAPRAPLPSTRIASRRRRWAGRSRSSGDAELDEARLGGDRRSERGEARRGRLGDRPQPPVARPRGPDIAFDRWAHMFEAAGWDDHGQVRQSPGRAVRAPGRPGAAQAHRRDAQRGVPAPAAAEPQELRERLPRGRARQAGGRAGRRRAARRPARPRRPRPGQADRGLPGDRPRPADRGLRVHDQGLALPIEGTRRTTRRC